MASRCSQKCGRERTPSPSTARRMPAMTSQPTCATTPSRTPASVRTAIFAADHLHPPRHPEQQRDQRPAGPLGADPGGADHEAEHGGEPRRSPSGAAGCRWSRGRTAAWAGSRPRSGPTAAWAARRASSGDTSGRRRRWVRARHSWRLCSLSRDELLHRLPGLSVVGRRRGAVVQQRDDGGERPSRARRGAAAAG